MSYGHNFLVGFAFYLIKIYENEFIPALER